MTPTARRTGKKSQSGSSATKSSSRADPTHQLRIQWQPSAHYTHTLRDVVLPTPPCLKSPGSAGAERSSRRHREVRRVSPGVDLTVPHTPEPEPEPEPERQVSTRAKAKLAMSVAATGDSFTHQRQMEPTPDSETNEQAEETDMDARTGTAD